MGAGLLGHGPGLLGGHAGAFGAHGHFPAHPVTHPGFSTLGYPGHAMATLDIKVREAEVKIHCKSLPISQLNPVLTH